MQVRCGAVLNAFYRTGLNQTVPHLAKAKKKIRSAPHCCSSSILQLLIEKPHRGSVLRVRRETRWYLFLLLVWAPKPRVPPSPVASLLFLPSRESRCAGAVSAGLSVSCSGVEISETLIPAVSCRCSWKNVLSDRKKCTSTALQKTWNIIVFFLHCERVSFFRWYAVQQPVLLLTASEVFRSVALIFSWYFTRHWNSSGGNTSIWSTHSSTKYV